MKLQHPVRATGLTTVTVWETVCQTTRLGNYLHHRPIRPAVPERDGRNQSPWLVMRNIFSSRAERIISSWADGSTGPVYEGRTTPNSNGLRSPGGLPPNPQPASKVSITSRCSSLPDVPLSDKHPLIGTSALASSSNASPASWCSRSTLT